MERKYVCAMGILGLLATSSLARAASVEVPNEMKQEVRRLTSLWKQGRTSETQQLADNVADLLYQWAARTMREASAEDLIAAMKGLLPVVSEDVRRKTGGARDVYKPAGVPLALGVATWRGDGRQLLAMRVDRIFQPSPKSNSYLQSRPPVFIAKEAEDVVVGDLRTWRYSAFRPDVYVFHGFIEGPTKQSWPDVLVGAGPGGSGLYFYFAQMHLTDPPAKDWVIVWEFDRAFVQEIEFAPGPNTLKVSYALGRHGAQMGVDTMQLTHGSKGTLIGSE